ncbi:Nuclear pore complex protein 15 [Toxocara canis]|uniref:Nuclear pore complex protein 15 n=1 Tax=Toxocara canis TaxID=6265 RepID=A0A0B2V2H9_TOXCA|nr:Nuclear pore complex protein 15 [Toxocara canis]
MAIKKSASYVPYLLQLPPSGLPYTVRTIRVFTKARSSAPGVIAVSPEGTIRYWSNINRGYSDSSVDLEREVALSLDDITDCEGNEFLLSTTTGSFFLLWLDTSGRAPTPGKRQKMTCGILSRPLYTNARRNIGERMSSLLFGDTAKHGSRLLKATLVEIMNHADEGRSAIDKDSIENHLKGTYIIALKSKAVQLYSIEPSAKMWSVDLKQQAAEHFANHIWNLHSAPEHSKWRKEIRIWLVDCVRASNGIIILMGAANNAISTQIHFALGYLPINGPEEATEHFEWFCVLKLPSSETFRSTEEDSLADLSLHLPLESRQCWHERTEGLIIVTRHFAHSVRLPQFLQGNTDVGPIHSVSFADDVFIGSACDARFCYVMLKENGISRVRLLPRGFDASLARSISTVHLASHSADDTSEVDRGLLADAFLLFAKTDLRIANERVQNLLELRHSSVAQLCVNYAFDIVDAIPNDERWHAVGVHTRRKSALAKSSFLLKVHLDEQKKKVLAMFVLFIKSMGLFAKLDTTVHSPLSDSRSARSLLAELAEKVDVAIAIYNWSQEQPVTYFDAAINSVLHQREEMLTVDLLTPYDYFFSRLSRVDDLLDALLLEEENLLSANTELSEKLLCIEEVGAALVVFVNAIEQHREQALVDTGDHLKWTQQRRILSPIIRQLDVIFDYLPPRVDGSDRTGSQLRSHVVALSSFVLAQQSHSERLGSPIIAKFINIGEQGIGTDLAKKFHDYRTLIELTETLSDEKRRCEIEQYKSYFNTPEFLKVLHEYYLQKGQLKRLLQEEGPKADEFFSSHSAVNWIREIDRGQFDKASHSLKSLAQRRDDDVVARKNLLSFAKLAALCADEKDAELLDEIKGGLRLVAHQENIPIDVLERTNALSSVSGKMRPMTAEQIISASVSDPRCDCDCHFRALLTLSSVLDEPASRSHSDLIKSLKAKIWLSAIKADTSLWKQLCTGGDGHKRTVYCELLNRLVESNLSDARKLELLPNVEELIGCMTELGRNQRFAFIMRSEEEAARHEVSELTKRRNEQMLRGREIAVAHGFAY